MMGYYRDSGYEKAIEDIRLLKLAESRESSHVSSFETFIQEQGYSMEELEELSESVELE